MTVGRLPTAPYRSRAALRADLLTACVPMHLLTTPYYYIQLDTTGIFRANLPVHQVLFTNVRSELTTLHHLLGDSNPF